MWAAYWKYNYTVPTKHVNSTYLCFDITQSSSYDLPLWHHSMFIKRPAFMTSLYVHHTTCLYDITLCSSYDLPLYITPFFSYDLSLCIIPCYSYDLSLCITPCFSYNLALFITPITTILILHTLVAELRCRVCHAPHTCQCQNNSESNKQTLQVIKY